MNSFLAADPTFENDFNTACDWFYMRGWQDATMHPVPPKLLGEGTLSAETIGNLPEDGFKQAVLTYSFGYSNFFSKWSVVEGDATMQKLQACYDEGYKARTPFDDQEKNKLFTKQYYIGIGIGAVAGVVLGGVVTYFIVR